YQLWLPSTRPAPPPASLADASMTPLASASFVSILTYAWLTPIMTLGWQRSLQAPDLWRVRAEEEAGPLSQSLDEAWTRRVEKAKANSKARKRWFGLSSRGGLFKVIGDVSQLMTPLLTKAIIQFAQKRARGGPDTPHIGQGVGLAIGLALLTICASVCTHQFFWRSMTTGVSARAALIASLYSRGLSFGPGETQYNLVNHVSTDVSRIDYCAQWFHAIWTAPIQISICLILLCLQLGPAALAGFSLFVFLIPIQKALMSYQLHIRKKIHAIGTQLHVDLNQEDALVIKDAEWVWYHQPKARTGKGSEEKQGNDINEKGFEGETDGQGPAKMASFRVTDITLNVPRGSVVGIVGPVGSGKSSLLLGLLGEMPRTRGSVSFGGKTAYCSQMAWIQNATLRDNVVFGRPWDEERYWSSIRDASLELDLELLPDGDLTEIGEKGINLSGGQKQRVNIARALYDNSAEVFLLDDPLSAVDAHVGHALFHNAILNNLKSRGKTVLLVTHALHFLPAVDRVYSLEKVYLAASEDS
ncbi:hypothetical protein FRC11_012543, partial [Ceratobasidium sp. 423]